MTKQQAFNFELKFFWLYSKIIGFLLAKQRVCRTICLFTCSWIFSQPNTVEFGLSVLFFLTFSDRNKSSVDCFNWVKLFRNVFSPVVFPRLPGRLQVAVNFLLVEAVAIKFSLIAPVADTFPRFSKSRNTKLSSRRSENIQLRFRQSRKTIIWPRPSDQKTTSSTQVFWLSSIRLQLATLLFWVAQTCGEASLLRKVAKKLLDCSVEKKVSGRANSKHNFYNRAMSCRSFLVAQSFNKLILSSNDRNISLRSWPEMLLWYKKK